MIISKSKGEKMADKDLRDVYGGYSCGGQCGDCDCRSSGGDKFYDAFHPEMIEFDVVLNN